MQRFADSVRSRFVLRQAGWLVLLALLLPTVATAMPVVISTTASTNGPLARTEWIVQAGPSPIDTFRMTRLARDVPAHNFEGALLLLPALGSSFVQYEQRAPHGAFGSAIAEFFAVRGYDVWGYSPRYEGISAGSCEAGAVDCTSMAGWSIQSMVDDIGFVRDQIELLNPGTQVVAGGFSLGAILSIAVANDDPTRYAGIIPWEGMLESPDPGVQALNAGYCAGLEAQIMAGLSYDGVSNNV